MVAWFWSYKKSEGWWWIFLMSYAMAEEDSESREMLEAILGELIVYEDLRKGLREKVYETFTKR